MEEKSSTTVQNSKEMKEGAGHGGTELISQQDITEQEFKIIAKYKASLGFIKFCLKNAIPQKSQIKIPFISIFILAALSCGKHYDQSNLGSKGEVRTGTRKLELKPRPRRGAASRLALFAFLHTPGPPVQRV